MKVALETSADDLPGRLAELEAGMELVCRLADCLGDAFMAKMNEEGFDLGDLMRAFDHLRELQQTLLDGIECTASAHHRATKPAEVSL